MTIIISILSLISAIIIANDEFLVSMVNLMYFSSSFFITKMIGIFLSCFLLSYCFLKKNDEYSVILLTSGVEKSKSFISKILIIYIIIFLYYFIVFLFFVLIGYTFTNKFVFSQIYLTSYIRLYVLSFYYGMVSLVLVQIINNIYVIIMTFSIFLVGSIINEEVKENSLKVLYNIFFPNFSGDDRNIYLGDYYLLFLCLLIIIINLFIYVKKDLQ